MELKIFRFILFIGSTFSTGWTNATDPVNDAQWETDSIRVGFHQSVPSDCIFATIGSSNTWNAVGANFYFFTDTTPTHLSISQQTEEFNNQHITVEAADRLSTEDVLMETRFQLLPGTFTIINSDIYVHSGRINQADGLYPDYSCMSNLPSDKS